MDTSTIFFVGLAIVSLILFLLARSKYGQKWIKNLDD